MASAPPLAPTCPPWRALPWRGHGAPGLARPRPSPRGVPAQLGAAHNAAPVPGMAWPSPPPRVLPSSSPLLAWPAWHAAVAFAARRGAPRHDARPGVVRPRRGAPARRAAPPPALRSRSLLPLAGAASCPARRVWCGPGARLRRGPASYAAFGVAPAQPWRGPASCPTLGVARRCPRCPGPGAARGGLAPPTRPGPRHGAQVARRGPILRAASWHGSPYSLCGRLCNLAQRASARRAPG
jgi:hypothetical protein